MSYLQELLADQPSIVYKLDEASGSSITDYSGNGDTGTIVGTATYQVAGPVNESNYVGMGFRTASVFVKNTNTLNFAIATIEVWMKAPTPAGDSQIVGFVQANSTAISDKDLILTSLGKLRGYVFDGVGKSMDASLIVGDNGWHLLHLVADGAHLTLYIDGVSSGTPIVIGNTFTGYAAGQPSVQLGGSQTGNAAVWQSQDLAWFAVYQTALSSSRISAHYVAASKNPLATTFPKPVLRG